jgi:hypothetical protein
LRSWRHIGLLRPFRASSSGHKLVAHWPSLAGIRPADTWEGLLPGGPALGPLPDRWCRKADGRGRRPPQLEAELTSGHLPWRGRGRRSFHSRALRGGLGAPRRTGTHHSRSLIALAIVFAQWECIRERQECRLASLPFIRDWDWRSSDRPISWRLTHTEMRLPKVRGAGRSCLRISRDEPVGFCALSSRLSRG